MRTPGSATDGPYGRCSCRSVRARGSLLRRQVGSATRRRQATDCRQSLRTPHRVGRPSVIRRTPDSGRGPSDMPSPRSNGIDPSLRPRTSRRWSRRRRRTGHQSACSEMTAMGRVSSYRRRAASNGRANNRPHRSAGRRRAAHPDGGSVWRLPLLPSPEHEPGPEPIVGPGAGSSAPRVPRSDDTTPMCRFGSSPCAVSCSRRLGNAVRKVVCISRPPIESSITNSMSTSRFSTVGTSATCSRTTLSPGGPSFEPDNNDYSES